MLAHTDYEIRTSLDALVAGEELGLPFDLAMETDLVGPVSLQRLAGTAIGRIPSGLLEDLRDAADLGEMPDELASRAGVVLRGPDDSRWAWKVAEGNALNRILAAHARAVVERVSPGASAGRCPTCHRHVRRSRG